MARNIILLSDGTGNSAAKIWKTNVWRLYQALDLESGDQIARYDDGVGTSSFKPLAILGGAIGWGLKRNLLDLYMFLCRNYRRGDKIYAFGFSRGSFTIRLLIGLVARIGLVPFDDEQELRRNAKGAYRTYRGNLRTNKYTNWLTVTPFRLLRDVMIAAWYWLRRYKLYSEIKPIKVPSIQFLGLWDTVDAYGLPMDELKRGVDLWIWPMSFADQDLNPKVRRACHAISVDDERITFHPVLWNEVPKDGRLEEVFPNKDSAGKAITKVGQERISQLWFAGVHSNVGGGYPDDSLSHISLKWIMDEARNDGLRFKPLEQQLLLEKVNLQGPIYDSRAGLSRYYRYGPRKIELLTQDTIDNEAPVVVPWPKIHESVLRRALSATDPYAPIVLPAQYAVVMDNGDIRTGPYPGIPGGVAKNPFENGTQSRSRANQQEKSWNLVWWRRLDYFAALFATAYLIFFPVIHEGKPPYLRDVLQCLFEPLLRVVHRLFAWLIDPAAACFAAIIKFVGSWLDWLAKFVTPAVDLIVDLLRQFLPGSSYLEAWFSAYRNHPGWFLLGIVVLLGFVGIGSSLKSRIFGKMGVIWEGILVSSHKPARIVPPPTDWLYKLRSSRLYLYLHSYVRWYALPTVFAALIVYLAVMVVLCWRVIIPL